MLSEENHPRFHNQSKEDQDEMNKKFQEYKGCKVVLVDNLDLGIEVRVTSFDIPGDRPKEIYNRAKVKRETMRMIEEMEK